MVNKARHLYEFGPYSLDPDRRQLLRDRRPVPLQPKAFDILLVLVENSDRVVPKDEILKAVWPETFIEESNLAQNIFVLRKALGGEEKRYIVTMPGRGYRFAERVLVIESPDESRSKDDTKHELIVETHSRSRLVVEEQELPMKALPGRASHLRRVLQLGAVASVVLAAGVYFYLRHTHPLTSKDTLVMADFANSTGDPVFEDTLRHGLGVALRQSPFLNILSDDKVKSTLRLMTKPESTEITKDVAREVCQRAGSVAYITGSIASLGKTYVLALDAVNCQTGDIMAAQQATAPDKEHAVTVLGRAASAMRRELGESLSSVRKFNVPLEQATTSSLDALKAYTQGQRAKDKGDDATARDLFSRAVELDPNFALAFAALGITYSNLGETDRANEYYRRAFALRDRTTDRERLYIEASYYSNVTGETDRTIQIYQQWIQSYPQDPVPHARLASKYGVLGKYEQATSELLATMKLEPDNAGDYGILIESLLAQNRLNDAKRMEQEATAKHLGGYVLRAARYYLAFLNDDEAAMRAQLSGDDHSPEYLLFNVQANTEAYHGRYRAARDYSQRAVEAAKRNDSKEMAAAWLANAAAREAEVGNRSQALNSVQESEALSFGKPVKLRAAIALARASDTAHAQEIADDLDKEFPLDTLVQNYYLPVVRAAISLNSHEPQRAIEILQHAEAYELGGPPELYPAYLRGLAYLETGQGKAAAKEFQKMLDHRGIILNHIPGALAQLQLARAQLMAGDRNAARKSYQVFFALWKDADSDIPILAQAKAEYGKF